MGLEVLRLGGESFRDFIKAVQMGGSDAQTLCNICFLLDTVFRGASGKATQLVYEYALALYPTHVRLNYYFGKHLSERAMELQQDFMHLESLSLMVRARAYFKNAL